MPIFSSTAGKWTFGVGVFTVAAIAYYRYKTGKDDGLALLKQVRIIERKDPGDGRTLVSDDWLKARAEPNERLKTTFGIDNIFTSTETKRCTQFRNEAVVVLKEAVRVSDAYGPDAVECWTPLIKHIRATVATELSTTGGSINLAELVQCVTLNVSLKYLFHVTDDTLHRYQDGVEYIAGRINSLWIKSKNVDESARPVWEDETDMHHCLQQITGLDPLVPGDNPMNLILPSYETMWRAVHRGLLEIFFRDPDSATPQHWKGLLSSFLANPSPRNWRKDDDVFELSALDVVKEVLRLYPPTRHIYRKYPHRAEYFVADLEALHRHPRLASNDPLKFRPERWVDIKQECAQQTRIVDKDLKDFEEQRGFVPFAKVCPAGKGLTKSFGWKLIALLVASLIEGLENLDGSWVLKDGDADFEFPTNGEAFKSGREAYLNLRYVKDSWTW